MRTNSIFQTRVCLGCGKISQPGNLITPQKFCNKCGTALESTLPRPTDPSYLYKAEVRDFIDADTCCDQSQSIRP